jgi:DNA topoisomerase VI subunit A
MRPYLLQLSPRWKRAVDKMFSVRRKASFEVMHERGYNYVANNFLPEVINQALGEAIKQ